MSDDGLWIFRVALLKGEENKSFRLIISLEVVSSRTVSAVIMFERLLRELLRAYSMSVKTARRKISEDEIIVEVRTKYHNFSESYEYVISKWQ